VDGAVRVLREHEGAHRVILSGIALDSGASRARRASRRWSRGAEAAEAARGRKGERARRAEYVGQRAGARRRGWV